MTSMLLTASSGAAARSSRAVIARSGANEAISLEDRTSGTRLLRCARNDRGRVSAHLAGIGLQVLVAGVFLGCRLDHRPHQLLVGIDPVGDEVPALAVPLEDPGGGDAGMVGAGHLQRLDQAGKA